MNASNLPLEGKVAIVTGGGTGLGRAIALEFAKAGADVAVASRTLAHLETAAEEIKSQGKRALAIQTDVTNKSDVENMVKRVVDEFGTVDILVNNSGGSGGSRVESIIDCPEEDWDRIVDLNLKGCYLCSQAVSKIMMEKKKGNIINMSSTSGLSTDRGEHSPYNVSKAGVVLLTRCLAWELGPYNVRVNAIAPGYFKTDATRRVWEDPEILKVVASRRPLNRVGEPIELGPVAVFLASDASTNITGQTIVSDGGLTA